VLVAHAKRPLKVRLDSGRLREIDVAEQVGDNGRLCTATGWQPRIPLEKSLLDLLDDIRTRNSK
jgi:GDP-4-dehydro-6-deoxy-D-mannose reductase